MAETLGSLVDKLSIVNLKLWFTQDAVHKATAAGEGLDPETTVRLQTLNLQRNSLMSEVDNLFAEAIQTGVAPLEARIKIL